MATIYKDSDRFVNPLVNPLVNPFVNPWLSRGWSSSSFSSCATTPHHPRHHPHPHHPHHHPHDDYDDYRHTDSFHYWRRWDPPVLTAQARRKFIEGSHHCRFSSSDLIEAICFSPENVFFNFHLTNQLLATIYKDSETQNAPNVCFKHFCDHTCVKPTVFRFWEILSLKTFQTFVLNTFSITDA